MEAFTALADPVRRQILGLLAERELTAGEIADRFAITRPAISRHLKVLREAGLASVRGDAQRRIYALEPKPLDELEAWIAAQKRTWARKFDALGAHLDSMAEADGKR
jgi:DNA-binding transcriptional ArsR family regulator